MGDKKAIQCIPQKSKHVGFWDDDCEIGKVGPQIRDILADIQAFDKEVIPKNINDHLDFKI